jgi:hypothetical protein
VKVQFLVEPGNPGKADAVSTVAREIQFYLIDLRERNPWAYAQYHCGTCANIYSKVHWSFCEPGKRVQVQGRAEMESTAGKRAAATRKRRAAGKKAAATRKRRAAAKKGVKTRVWSGSNNVPEYPNGFPPPVAGRGV